MNEHAYFCQQVLHAFDGCYIDPGRFSTPGDPEKKPALTRPVNPRAPARNVKEDKQMQSTIGTFEPYTAKDGSKVWQLKLRLPFAVRADFIVKKNENKNKETAPDAKVYYHGLEVGAIWSKAKKDDPAMVYKSGQVLCPFLPNGELSFAIFRDKEDEKNPVQKVVADFASRNAVSAISDSDFS